MNSKKELIAKYGCMSLSKFLSRYYSLSGKNLKNTNHREVKILFPKLRMIPLDDFATSKRNIDLLRTKKVVIVNDGKDSYAYYVPEITRSDELIEFNREEDTSNKIDDTVYDYSKMSIYELRCLLVRKFNSSRNQMCAKKELTHRGVVLHKKYDRNSVKKDGIEGE